MRRADARVVVTTGPHVDPASLRAPAGVEVHRFVPHDELMPRASVVVGHGGHGTRCRRWPTTSPVVVLPWTHVRPPDGRPQPRAGGRRPGRAGRTASAAGRRAMLSGLCSPTARTAPPRRGWVPGCARRPGPRVRRTPSRPRSSTGSHPEEPVKGSQVLGSGPPCKAFTHLRSRRAHSRTARRPASPEEQRCPVHAVCLPSCCGAALVAAPAVVTASPAVADHTALPSG